VTGVPRAIKGWAGIAVGVTMLVVSCNSASEGTDVLSSQRPGPSQPVEILTNPTWSLSAFASPTGELCVGVQSADGGGSRCGLYGDVGLAVATTGEATFIYGVAVSEVASVSATLPDGTRLATETVTSLDLPDLVFFAMTVPEPVEYAGGSFTALNGAGEVVEEIAL
jgi:hypothetical protein